MDLIDGCMSDLQTKDVALVETLCCQWCRNPQCQRAKAGDRFAKRVSTQATRLLRPEYADPLSSRYEGLQDFKDMMESAMRLEIADRVGDWSIPSIPDFSKLQTPTNRPPRNFQHAEPVAEVDEPVDEVAESVVAKDDGAPTDEPVSALPPAKVGAAQLRPGNTLVPIDGFMIGSPVATTSAVTDPWTAPAKPKDTIVKPGATIKMGG